MPYDINETHDPKLESWVESANDPETDFPIQNLPLCRFRLSGSEDSNPNLGAVIGDRILNLTGLEFKGLFQDIFEDPELELVHGLRYKHEHTWWMLDDEWDSPSMYLRLPLRTRSAVRTRLIEILRADSTTLRDDPALRAECVLSRAECQFVLPGPSVPNYTDFYASLHHATNVGSMFRPDNPLLPNYKHIPIGYHGRASSIVPNGTPIRRPIGQRSPAEEGGTPAFGPCTMLDYELELAAIIGRGNELGEPISMADAEDHIFGMCILNDWSARDMQKWEYQPLGPFLAKNFASTVSPYIVTMEALAPFRTPAFERAPGDPQPLSYLDSEYNRASGGVDITCEAYLASAEMRKRGMSPFQLSKGSFRHMYWTLAQFVAHHTVNGCNLQPGDLLGSGTISGPARDGRGCLLELTWDGDPWGTPPTVVPGTQRTPIKLPTGEERKFLADGDEVIIKAYCKREGFRRIGFGECRGIIEPASAI